MRLNEMKKYRVMVEGLNFPIRVDTETTRHGFFTTRFVEVGDEDEAEKQNSRDAARRAQDTRSERAVRFAYDVRGGDSGIWNRLASSKSQERGSVGTDKREGH